MPISVRATRSIIIREDEGWWRSIHLYPSRRICTKPNCPDRFWITNGDVWTTYTPKKKWNRTVWHKGPQGFALYLFGCNKSRRQLAMRKIRHSEQKSEVLMTMCSNEYYPLIESLPVLPTNQCKISYSCRLRPDIQRLLTNSLISKEIQVNTQGKCIHVWASQYTVSEGEA